MSLCTYEYTTAKFVLPNLNCSLGSNTYICVHVRFLYAEGLRNVHSKSCFASSSTDQLLTYNVLADVTVHTKCTRMCTICVVNVWDCL